MGKASGKENKTWKIIAAVISGAYIIYLWSTKDLPAGLSSGDILPLLVTNIAVSMGKLALVAAAILGIKWLRDKFKNR